MTEYIRERGFLSSDEIDCLIAATPTRPLTKGEILNWQTWIQSITAGDAGKRGAN
jgi:hypothetical protein